MSVRRSDEPLVSVMARDLAGGDWIELLSSPGAGHDEALQRLHELLLRAARQQVSRMQPALNGIGQVRQDDIINQAADEAMISLLGKLATFEGRSRFTTWAYKFGILQAAVEVNRSMWRHREVPLDDVHEPLAAGASPEQFSEAADFSIAVGAAIEQTLTDHQRRVVLALLVDDVPIDVLAERLGTSRNTLYKTLHDARKRLRAHLTATGFLPVTKTPELTP
jgi:RNA polymerase sigma-70 factor (ECF subfamily)